MLVMQLNLFSLVKLGVILMNKKLRTIPFPAGSIQRRNKIDYLMCHLYLSYKEAVARISAANYRARDIPMLGERCGATTRRQTSCMCKALANGRCKLHGGLSTGPKTAQGKGKSAANLLVKHEYK